MQNKIRTLQHPTRELGRPPHLVVCVVVALSSIFFLTKVARAQQAAPQQRADQPNDGKPGFGPDAVVLTHRWENDPPLGIDWTPMESHLFPHEVDLQRVASSVLQHRVNEAQQIVFRENRTSIVNPGEAFELLVSRLQNNEESNEQARRAFVSAALSLADSRVDVESLWKAVASDPVLQSLVEPRLVEVRSEMAVALWRERVNSARRNTQPLRTAVQGLGAVGSSNDRLSLERILRSDFASLPTRLLATRSLAQLFSSGLERLSKEVGSSGLPQQELLAAELLSGHSSSAAIEQLDSIARGDNPVAQAAAFRFLASNAPETAREFASQAMSHREFRIRQTAVEVLNRQDDEDSLRQQGAALGDENTHVRRQVRENLREKYHAGQHQEIIDELVDNFFSSDISEAIEQCILLTVELEQHHRAQALFQLLSYPDNHVNIRAAWALKALELDDDLLSEVFVHCQAITKDYVSETIQKPTEQYRTSFLLETLGKHRFAPAESMLMKYVPKHAPMDSIARVSAVYALGLIFEDSKNGKLAQTLVQRAADDNELDPEDDLVRYAAAVAVGRIGSTGPLRILEKILESPPSAIGEGRDWAIRKLGGTIPTP